LSINRYCPTTVLLLASYFSARARPHTHTHTHTVIIVICIKAVSS